MNRNLLTLIVAGLLSLPLAASAQVLDYNIFEEDFLDQTGPATASSSSWVFTANLSTQNSTDLSSVTVTAPNSNVYNLTDTSAPDASPTNFVYQDSAASQSSLQSAYPLTGTYTFATVGNNLPSDSGSITVPNDLSYPSSLPIFTNYASFQNANAAAALTFTYSGYTPLTGQTQNSYEFVSVIDALTNQTVYSEALLPSSTTSFTVPAGTLSADTSYYAVLDYSNREYLPDDTGFSLSNDSGVTPFVGLDYSVTADFTTAAVPEPTSVLMGLVGLGSLVFARRLLRRA